MYSEVEKVEETPFLDISLQTFIRENSGFNSVILKQSIRLYSWYTKQKHTLLPSVINVDILENKDMEIHKDNERSQFPKILSCKVWDATFKCRNGRTCYICGYETDKYCLKEHIETEHFEAIEKGLIALDKEKIYVLV